METSLKKRPTSVTVIGWIFISIAGLMLLGGLMGFIVHSFMKQMGGMPPMPEDIPRPFKIMSVVFQHFDVLAIVQIIISIFILIAAVFFLKLHSWARTVLEITSWIGLVYVIVFGIFWVVSWISITSSIPIEKETPSPLAMFNIFGAIMGIIVTIVFAVPLAAIIKFLRGKTIKEAVA